MRRFEGKVALVTGGTTGIGLAAAQAFAREGAKVVIAARRAEIGELVVEDIKSSGGEAVFIRADMAVPADIETLVRDTCEIYGRLDCAFNNAASPDGIFKSTADFTEEEYDCAMAANLKGVWLCMKHEINQMLKQQPSGGTIVNTSSGNGLGGAQTGSLYSAAKAGVIALAKSAAQEYIRQGIRINVLVPGYFETPMLDLVRNRASGGVQKNLDVLNNKVKERVPAGRIGNPEEAAQAALWLCSDESSYVVGHSLIIDGGLTSPWR